MLKAQVAEWILSLFTSRELAESTVGDWLEEVPVRGTWWFWSTLCRTAGSFIWRDFAADPRHTAGLAFRAWLLQIACLFGWLLLIVLAAAAFGAFMGIFVAAGAFAGGIPDWTAKAQWLGTWIFKPLGLIVVVRIQFQVGKWTARRSRGREVAACIGYEIVSLLGSFVLEGLLLRFVTLTPAMTTNDAFSNTEFYLSNLLLTCAFWAGAILVRRRQNSLSPVK
ncbi:MAG TPA: hypothetical protein VG273_03940 [Bryobacteraceae bacterium]|nr:hypothetical protein [Bryobacteraceae bacterium]